MLKLKRVYEPAEPEDGARVLVDRLWPRGLTKAAARVDLWAKELAPSGDLRQWFSHRPERFDEFRRRYRAELAQRLEPVRALADRARGETVTLLFAARDPTRCNATVLRELLEERL
jgi:uncharacterized protein YeaO (DUF488 family)